MEKLDGKTFDVLSDNIKKLEELFPEIVTEGSVDVDKLALLFDKARNEDTDGKKDGEERYEFTWKGKKEAIRMAQKQTTGTLRPCKEESVNFDETQNLYIEGDNLEVLRALQSSYRCKIKMIYIDPPYNTGKDFVYKDNFNDNIQNYKEMMNESHKTNTDSIGRFHTNWLNMMYPRLRLAKNLLKDDGVIFISIDENEITNLSKLCDEVFGAANHLETFHIQVRYSNKSLNEDNDFQPVMEYILVYSKNKKEFKPNKPSQEYDLSKFCYSFNELTEGETISIGNKTVTIFKAGEWNIQKHDTGRVGLLKETWASGSIVRQSGTAAEFLAKYLIDRKPVDGLGVLYKIHNMGEDGLGYRYVTGPLKEDAIRGKFYSGVPLERQEEIKNGTALKYSPITNFYDYSGDFGNIRHEGGISFNGGKKPIKMLNHLLFTGNLQEGDIVMDFFSGSASLAHSVMQYNIDNCKNINYILVQIPEKINEKDDLFKAGFENICQVGKERIKKSGEKIFYDNKDKEGIEDLDIGFKVFKLDTTNIKEWDDTIINTDEIKWNVEGLINPIKDGRSKEDVIYEILLKYGVDLTMPIEEVEIMGSKVYSVGFGYLMICLEKDINLDLIEAIGEQKPNRVVLYDNGLDNESKTNGERILKELGVKDIRTI